MISATEDLWDVTNSDELITVVVAVMRITFVSTLQSVAYVIGTNVGYTFPHFTTGDYIGDVDMTYTATEQG